MKACADALRDSSKCATESEAFGQLVAAKHAKLTVEQKLYAETLIMEQVKFVLKL